MAQRIKNPSANAGVVKDAGSVPGSGRSPGEAMATHASNLTWRIPCGHSSLMGYSPWGCRESGTLSD